MLKWRRLLNLVVDVCGVCVIVKQMGWFSVALPVVRRNGCQVEK